MQRVRSGMFVFFSTISLITLLLFGNVFLTNAQSGDIPRVWTITPDMSTFLADTATYTVTFNQAVTGVDATDFFVRDTDAQIDTVEAITPAEFRIIITNIASKNTPLLVLADDDTIVNDAGVPLGGIGHGNGNGVSNLAITRGLHTQQPPSTDSMAQSDTSIAPIARSPRSVLHKVGQNNSIALTADGIPVISYVDVTNSDLKLAICDDITCANPSISTLDSEYDVGYFSSLALTTNDIPVIGYYDVIHRSLKLAVCNNTACTSPTISTIDNSNSVGAYLDLALTSDNKPVLSYLDSTNYDLMLAVCNNTACTSPTISRLDSDDVVGLNTSIALKSGNLPVISYHDATNTSLKLVICDDTACTSKTISTLDSADITGEYSSIAVTSDNKPIISYQNGTSGDLKLAICNNSTCSSPLISTLDSTNYVGLETSLALTSDNDAIISYFDMTNGILKIAKCDGIPCANPVIFTVDSVGAQGLYSSMAINASDDFVMSYYDYDYGILKLHTAPIIIDAGQPNSFAKSTPTNAQRVTTSSTTLTWASSTYADSYEYCIATSIAACTTWVSTESTASTTVTGLTHGSTYYWQVRASNSSGTRLADSDDYHSFTVTLLPTSFAKSSPANNATKQSTSVTLTWAASTYATSYEYCIALTAATCTTWKSTGTARTATVTGLTKNKAYYWQVRAKNAGGTTLSATTYWKFTTAP